MPKVQGKYVNDPFPDGTRNSERIEPVIEAVEERWREHPDMRLGQLLSNIAGGDPFTLEDDILIARLGEEMGCDYYVPDDDSDD